MEERERETREDLHIILVISIFINYIDSYM